MTLREKQSHFMRMVQLLLNYAHFLGYELTEGDAYRDPRAFGAYGQRGDGYGHPSSFHKQRLAIDLNLFKDGVYLQETEDHQRLGAFWEFIGGSWGGRWKDGNHYSYGEDR